MTETRLIAHDHPIAADAGLLAMRRTATRTTFFLAGMALACWAPLVPFAKMRLGIDDATLGLLLLSLGMGSVIAMPLAGALTGRFGCRAVIVTCGLVLVATMPCLPIAETAWGLAAALALFGAALGAIDVSMNIQAVMVERESRRVLMSGFHGMFTLGSIAGAGGTSIMLALGASSFVNMLVMSAVVFGLLLFARPHLLTKGGHENQASTVFVLPNGQVVVIGIFCLVIFLAEGVVLDWGALFLIEQHGLEPAFGGMAYTAFAIAMTIARFTGDAVVRRMGEAVTVLGGGCIATAGFLCVVMAPSGAFALIGFAAVGLGAANLVPVFFSAAGRQPDMPANLALSAVTTMGYGGILLGPALVGLIAHQFSLNIAILLVGLATLLVSLRGRLVVGSNRCPRATDKHKKSADCKNELHP